MFPARLDRRETPQFSICSRSSSRQLLRYVIDFTGLFVRYRSFRCSSAVMAVRSETELFVRSRYSRFDRPTSGLMAVTAQPCRTSFLSSGSVPMASSVEVGSVVP